MLPFVLFLATLSEPVAPGDVMAIFKADDYPVEASDHNIQGEVIAEVDVSVEGVVNDCRIKRSAGSALLDSATCRLIRERGRFVETRKQFPGRKLTLTFPVRWALEDVPTPVDVMIHRIIFSIAKGEVGECRSEVVAGPGILGDACKAARGSAAQGIRRWSKHRPVEGKEYVLEMATLPGDHRESDGIGGGEGEQLLSKQTVLLTISESGKVGSCVAGENSGPADYVEQWCKGIVANEQFPPLEAGIANRTDREMTRIHAIYLRAPNRP